MFGVLKKIFAFAGEKRPVLKRAIVVAFFGAIFSALQFGALFLTLDIVISGKKTSLGAVIAILLISVFGRLVCFFFSSIGETDTGYFMVAEKRVHIGDRLRYIPMGYFNENSLGNITALVTTTLGDVENTAARCLVIIVGGFLNTFALCLALTCIDVRLGCLALVGIVFYLLVTEFSTRASAKTGPARQHAQAKLVEAVLEYVQGMAVVKSYGLEKDNDQAVNKTVEDSCNKALSLEASVVPWMAFRQIVVRVFGVLIAGSAVVFYFQGSLALSHCLLMLIASFMIYQELENAGNMSDNLQMLGASMDKANTIDDTPVMDIDGEDIKAKDASVEFSHVSFSYGDSAGAADRKILDDVSFQIKKGETLGIVGESGCGKTTLGRCILQIPKPTDGEICFHGEPVTDANSKEFRKKMQIVFQDPYASLDPRKTVADIIGEALDIHGLCKTREERKGKVLELMKMVGLNEKFYNRYPHEFSGGQRQRIGIARALAVSPEFIVCDEPVSALDVSIQAQVINMLERLQREKQLTYLFIAHDLAVVKHISDRIGVLYLGHLVELADSEELYREPMHPYTQMLLSAVPIADPDASEKRQRVKLTGEVPSPINPPSGCPFRTRCMYATDACAEEFPKLQERKPGHFVACYRQED